MKLLPSLAVALVTAASFAAPDPFDQKVANFQLLTQKPIQTELKITEAQRKKMNTFGQSFEKESKSLVDSYQKAKKQMDAEFQKKSFANLTKLRNSVLGVLSDAQLKRLREITIQVAGKVAVLDVNVAEKLGISKSQRETVSKLYTEAQQKLQAIQTEAIKALEPKYREKEKSAKTDKDRQALQAAFQKELQAELKKREPRAVAIQKDYDGKMSKQISKAQWAKLDALKGKPFKPKA